MLRRSMWSGCVVVALMVAGGGVARGEFASVLVEHFSDDPVAAGRAGVTAGDASRFTFDLAGGALAASYDTLLDTAKLAWPLPVTLNETVGFRVDVDFTFLDVSAVPNGFAQIAFGLINSMTTGNDRVGGGSGDGFDVVTVDYFPNVSQIFFGPTLSPTVIETNDGVSGFLPAFDDPNTPNEDESKPGSFVFPFGDETDLTDEGSLPVGTPIHASLTYDAAMGLLTLRVDGVDINSVGAGDQDGGGSGGRDGDSTTIESFLPAEAAFSVDSFAITLWQDTFGGGVSTVQADVRFDFVEVFAVVPEPASAMILLIGVGFAAGRRRWLVCRVW